MPPILGAFRTKVSLGILRPMEKIPSSGQNVPAPKSKGFHVRMPDELRRRVDQAARENGNSVNAELVSRIKASFDTKATRDLEEIVKELRSLVTTLTGRVDR